MSVGFCRECNVFGFLANEKFKACRKCWNDKATRRAIMNIKDDEEDDFPAIRAPFPARPTYAMPGTPEKIAVMEARAERKEQVTHPFDAGYADDDKPSKWNALSEGERNRVLIESSQQTFSIFWS